MKNDSIVLRDIDPKLVRLVKTIAAHNGQTLKQFVLEAIRKAAKK